ncbi:uncharacterized protein isoform X2 [Choristoneura fumiferana]|uniref:uncharacterized protein isoform X2 n=1 Tax=Choristoneura fumiferana TaxID=7141 RepID=UPI003D15D33A
MLRITLFVLQYFPMLSLPILKEIKDVNVTDRPIPDDLERHKKRLRQRWKCNMHAGLLTIAFQIGVCAFYNNEKKFFIGLCEMRFENCMLKSRNLPVVWEYYQDTDCAHHS